LTGNTIAANVENDTLQKLKLWNTPVLDGTILALSSLSLLNCLFRFVKELEGMLNLQADFLTDYT